MPIPYDGQLRYAGQHELVAYAPTKTQPGGATVTIEPTGDLSPDWSNVLMCTQSATGEDAYVTYRLEIQEHGGNSPGTGVATYDQDRDVCRLSFRIRAPTVALGTGELLPILSLQSSGGAEYARVGVMAAGGENKPYLMTPDGVTHQGAAALVMGTWYDFDFLYSAPDAALSLDCSIAGANTWTSQVALAAVTGMAEVGVVRLGVLGSVATSQAAPRTALFHSLRWQFAEYRRCTYCNGTDASYGIASNVGLQAGASDFWIAGHARLEADVNCVVAAKERQGTTPDREYQLSYNATTKRYRWTVATGPSTVVAVESDAFGAPALGAWHFVMAWRSQADGQIHLRVDAAVEDAAAIGAPRTGAARFQVGANDFDTNGTVASNSFWNGRLNSIAFGKLAEGGLTPSIVTEIHDTLYNAGVPVFYNDLTDAFKAASGLVSYWDLDDVADGDPTRIDHHGTNNLAKGGTAAHKPGKAVVFMPSEASARAGVEEFVACRIADVSPSQASGLLVHRAGQWRGVTHARLAYQAGTSLTAPSFTAWTLVSTADVTNAYTVPLPITGLSGDTVYAYRWELSRDGSTADVQSDVRKFRTLPAVGQATPLLLHHWSCNQAILGILPNRDIGTMLDDLEADGLTLHRSMCLGDLFYENVYVQGEAGDQTTDDFVRDALESLYDPHLNRLMRSAATPFLPSDHEVLNDADSRIRTDAGVRSTLVASADSSVAVPQNTYDAGTTLGDIWDGSYAWMNAWYWQPWLTTDATAGTGLDQASGVMAYGRTWEIRLDLRWTGRDRTLSTFLGAGLKAWLKDQITAFNAAADADLLLLIVENPFTRINSHPTDSWRGAAEAEAQEITDFIADTVTTGGKGVVTLSGDKHAVFWADTLFEGAGRVVRTGPFALDYGCSPIAAAFYVSLEDTGYFDASTSPYMVDFWDYRKRYAYVTDAQNRHSKNAKSSGIVSAIDQAAHTISLEYWTDYGLHYQPAAVQNVSVVGAGSPNTAPALTLSSPAAGATIQAVIGDTIDCSATATDTQDGDLTASIQWTSSNVSDGTGGDLHTGGSFSLDTSGMAPGTRTITALVTDAGGLEAERSFTLVLAAAPTALTAGTLTLVSISADAAVFHATDATGGTPPYSYQLERSPKDAGTWAPVAGATSLDPTDATIAPGTAYDWRMKYTDSAAG